MTEKPLRRKFTAEYKLRILAEADRCSEYGQIGALLRREGLYSSHLSGWRRKRMEGTLVSLSPRKQGPKPEKNPRAPEVARLERENERLQRKLKQAETIIDVQKEVSGLLGIDLGSPESGEESWWRLLTGYPERWGSRPPEAARVRGETHPRASTGARRSARYLAR